MTVQATLEKLAGKLSGWLDQLILMLPNVVVAVLVVVVFGLLARLARRGLGRLLDRRSSREALNRLVGSTVSAIILVVGLVIALNVLQLQKAVLSVLAGVGIIGLALGFAFQDIASNFMAGVIMMLRRPFRVGDYVETNGYFGPVHAINLRNTVVRLLSGQLVLIPNKEVFQSPLKNFSALGGRRVEIPIGISYGDDLDKVGRVVLEAIRPLPGRDTAREVEVLFSEFGDSSINFMLRFWVAKPDQRDYLEARSRAIVAVKRAFDHSGITIPFPIRTLDFGIKGGATLAEVVPGLNAGQAASPTQGAQAQPDQSGAGAPPGDPS